MGEYNNDKMVADNLSWAGPPFLWRASLYSGSAFCLLRCCFSFLQGVPTCVLLWILAGLLSGRSFSCLVYGLETPRSCVKKHYSLCNAKLRYGLRSFQLYLWGYCKFLIVYRQLNCVELQPAVKSHCLDLAEISHLSLEGLKVSQLHSTGVSSKRMESCIDDDDNRIWSHEFRYGR